MRERRQNPTRILRGILISLMVRQSRFLQRVIVLCCAGMLATACATHTTISAGTTPLPRPKLKTRPPVSLTRAVASLQRAYDRGDWSAIRSEFTSRSASGSLVGDMQRWKQEGVSELQVSLVYTTCGSRTSCVGTLRVSADARATPAYYIYQFQLLSHTARFVRQVTGLSGSALAAAGWSVTRSAHFIVYHSRYQLQGQDRNVLQDLEFQRQQFIRKFGVTLPPLAAYYLFPEQGQMKQLTRGQCGSRPENVGCAAPFADPPSIDSVLWPTYHEPIHIYERALEPAPHANSPVVNVAPLFIGEGTAVALEDRSVDPRLSDYCSDLKYAPLDLCARIAIENVKPLSVLSDAGFDRADAGDVYSLGGSFVKYLILNYGYHRFGHFYYTLSAQPKDRIVDYNAATRAVYHTSIERLVADWTNALKSGN